MIKLSGTPDLSTSYQ
ncbi:hypothetical protein F383_12042 [Gossypium arboreum]|uniref:Uncharacterized protein n=1 Tax=Gossypium arboreum TaxID=29729 RepID=A0A0B0PQZ3_GOSAR|nr:hypothetical protein F383_12042 [Gossypium arboreum]